MQDRINAQLDRMKSGESCDFTVRNIHYCRSFGAAIRHGAYEVDAKLVDAVAEALHTNRVGYRIVEARVCVLPGQRASDRDDTRTLKRLANGFKVIVESAVRVERENVS